MGLERGSWSWGISFILIRCARPNLLLLSPLLHRTRLPPRTMRPLTWACRGRAGRISGQDFPLQPDGTLRCPPGQKLFAHEQRVIRRREPARRVWGKSPQLPSLSPARAMSMEWQSHW